eukprot:403339250
MTIKKEQNSQEYLSNQQMGNKMAFSQPNVTFFQEIYANYTQIWQSVLKLTLINNSLVDQQSFEKILRKSVIDVDNQYCQFLLATCQKSENQNENTNTQNLKTLKDQDKLVDYKFFLNSAIKALSLEQFDNETFIIEQFWKNKFGDLTHRQVSIEEFNQAFYQFFNKENRLLSIDFVDQIINECFSYLLKKNKKFISKRSFRKVVKRNFRDIFNLILFNLGQKALRKSQHNQLSGNKKCLKEDSSNDIIGACIQTTYYPDSLDTRSGRMYSRPNLITNNQSKSLYDTSTFFNYSSNANTRSKSSEMIHLNIQNNAHSTSLHQQSTFDVLAQKVGLLAEKTYDNRSHAAKYLELTIQKVVRQYHLRTGLEGLIQFKIQGSKKTRQKSRNNLQEKENQQPQFVETQNGETSKKNGTGSRQNSKKKQLMERQTFSFQNQYSKGTRDENLEIAYENYKLQNKNNAVYQNSENQNSNFLTQEEEEFSNQFEVNLQGTQKTANHKLQSYASLQYSNTPPLSYKIPNSQNRGDLPPSTKSNSILGNINYNHTARQSNYRQSSQKFSNYQNLPHPISADKIYQDYSKEESHPTNITETSIGINHSNQLIDHSMSLQKLDDILYSQATTNINSRRQSHGVAPKYNQNNSFKNLVKANYQNQKEGGQEFLMLQNPQILRSLDRLPLQDVSQSTIYNSNTNHRNNFNRKYSTGQIKTGKNIILQDASNSIITEVTPISNKDNISEFIDQSQSISKNLDLNTLQNQTRDQRQISRKPKELAYMEKKYRKSKEKIRSLLTENANEKTKSQALQKCNFVLGEKVEQLESQYEELVSQLQSQDQERLDFQNQLRFQELVLAFNLISRILKTRDLLQLKSKLTQWNDTVKKTKYKQSQVQQIQKVKQSKFLHKYFQAWIKYCINRQTRKEHRKLQKLQQKVLRNIFRRRLLIKKRKAFNFWKGPFMKNFMIEEVQKDINYAHQQVKSMRFIMSITKLSSFLKRKQSLSMFQALSQLVRFERALRTIQYQDQQESSDYENINFHPNLTMTMMHPKPSSLNHTFQMIQQQQQPQYTCRQQLNYNLQDKYTSLLNNGTSILPMSTLDNQSETQNLTNIITKGHQIIMSEGLTSPFAKNKIQKQSHENTQATNYNLKAQQQRNQNDIVEGLEKLYFVMRKQNNLMKEEYFYRWRLNIQEMYQEQNQNESKEYLISPQLIYNDVSGDLDVSSEYPNYQSNYNAYYQDAQNLQQPQQVQELCYYKTNEGYFYPIQQQQPNFTSCNQDSQNLQQHYQVEPISPITQKHSNMVSQNLSHLTSQQQIYPQNYQQMNQTTRRMISGLNMQLDIPSHNSSQAPSNPQMQIQMARSNRILYYQLQSQAVESPAEQQTTAVATQQQILQTQTLTSTTFKDKTEQ